MESRTLHKGKKVTTKAEIYFTAKDGRMLTNFTSPTEIILIVNDKGEAQHYNVKKNSVFSYQDESLSSNTQTLYYFFTGKTQDLGLPAAGFRLMKTRKEDKLVIAEWAPINPRNDIQKIELVYDNFLPIYAGYTNNGGAILKKVYFSDYYHSSKMSIPQKITEINYLEDKDSLINQTRYFNIKEDNQAISDFFQYKVPKNAKKANQK